MPLQLNKEEKSLEFYNALPNKRHDNYSYNMMFPSFLAPAVTQSLASSKMLVRRTGGGALFRRNTRAFLSFQMVQETSMVREAIAWR